MLTINNASKSYGSIPVLDDFSLVLPSHSVIGLAGCSGSGKSTLLRCIQGLELLDSGTIEFNGKSSFMFQDFQLFPHMTVEKNLSYAPKLLNQDHHAVDARVKELLNQLGIADKANAYPHQLSGGQKQRVALARSLMMNPSLLLCDEPTSGLDLAAIDDVIGLLASIKPMGVTMLIASHDLDFLSKIADKLIVLKNGQIAAEVNSKDLSQPAIELKQFYQE